MENVLACLLENDPSHLIVVDQTFLSCSSKNKDRPN